MDITLIGGNKLKIALSEDEAKGLSLDTGSPDMAGGASRRVLVSLLEEARERTGFSPKGAKLFVEMYPDGSGGCVVYFTALNRNGPGEMPEVRPVVFAFPDVDAMCEGCVRLHGQYGHRIYRSSVYRLKREYRLIAYPLDYCDRLSVYFASEYGRKVGEGEVLAAYVEEHGEAVVVDKALDTIAAYLG